MPTISRFYGVRIRMYWADHSPPHFHAFFGKHRAAIDIRSLRVLAGSLPRALLLTLEWAAQHRAALMEDWDLCARMEIPKRIPPLE